MLVFGQRIISAFTREFTIAYSACVYIFALIRALTHKYTTTITTTVSPSASLLHAPTNPIHAKLSRDVRAFRQLMLSPAFEHR